MVGLPDDLWVGGLVGWSWSLVGPKLPAVVIPQLPSLAFSTPCLLVSFLDFLVLAVGAWWSLPWLAPLLCGDSGGCLVAVLACLLCFGESSGAGLVLCCGCGWFLRRGAKVWLGCCLYVRFAFAGLSLLLLCLSWFALSLSLALSMKDVWLGKTISPQITICWIFCG